MAYIIVGLGNPGGEYRGTRHSVGREFVQTLAENWREDLKRKSLTAKRKLAGQEVLFVLPETFMNKSGEAVRKFVASKKAAEKLIVVHDDIDLPLGSFKISFNKSAGGHRGVESVIRAIKNQAFIRVRIGIAPVAPGGRIRKPKGEKTVVDFILSRFRPGEEKAIKKVFKQALEALECLLEEGKEKAMSLYN